MGVNLDHFIVQAFNTTGKIIANQEIQEEAIVSSCLMPRHCQW